MANNRVVSLVLTLAVVTSSASTSSGPYTNASITLSAPPAATYTIPADLLNSSSLNQSAKVTIVNPGGGIKPTLEWTALGDSYATGVGTTNYVDGTRCLRYDEAYPIIININPEYAPGGDAVLPPGLHQFNNVACSGAETKDIIKWQLLDKPTYHEPNPTYGNRPAFGSPEFATLTAGGDDIDFPGILFNCILGVHIPQGPTKRTCTDQRKFTWSLLNDGTYISDLGRVIDAIVQKGRRGPKGDDFRLYLTGYGRFFNADTTGSETNCDDTTFQISGLWGAKPLGANGASDARLTREMRQDFDNMADSLNDGIRKAVNNYNDPHVKFVDIQTDPLGRDVLAGHRFCEIGIQEPDVGNANLYFWHFPYAGFSDPQAAEPTDPFQNIFDTAYNKTWNDAGSDINAKYPKYAQFFSAVLDNITPELFQENDVPNWDDPKIWGGSLGYRTRVFHPQFKWHVSIATSILTQYLIDNGPRVTHATSSNSTSSSLLPTTTSTSAPVSATLSITSTSAAPTPDSAILASWSSSCDDANVCTGAQLIYSFTPGQPPPKPCGPSTIWDTSVDDFSAKGEPENTDLSMGPFSLNEWNNCVYTTTYSDSPTQ